MEAITLEERIKAQAISSKEWIDRRNNPNRDESTAMIDLLELVMLQKSSVEDTLIEKLQTKPYHEVNSFLESLICPNHSMTNGEQEWELNHPLIEKLIHRKHIFTQDSIDHLVRKFVFKRLQHEAGFDEFIQFLLRQSFTEEDILLVGSMSQNPFFSDRAADDQENTLSPFGRFLLPKLGDGKSFFGLTSKKGYLSRMNQWIFDITGYNRKNRLFSWLKLLYFHHPEGLKSRYQEFLIQTDEWSGKAVLNSLCAHFLIDHDAHGVEQVLLQAIEELGLEEKAQLTLLYPLDAQLNGKYESNIRAINEQHLVFFQGDHSRTTSFYGSSVNGKSLPEAYFEYLWGIDPQEARVRLEQFVHQSTFVGKELIPYLDKKFKSEAVPYLLAILQKEFTTVFRIFDLQYYQHLLDHLSHYDLSSHLDSIIDFAIHQANKKVQEIVAELLSPYQSLLQDKAVELLNGKTVNQRIVGALILSCWTKGDVEQVLSDAIDGETNDDTRDIMLEALSAKRFKHPFSLEQIHEMVDAADRRKKLSRWSEKWLIEDSIPKLYWTENGEPLTQKHLRFLLYRMKRAKGINSDIEAKQLLSHIDRSKSDPFTKALLYAFQDSNQDPKLKYYLTIAGLIGDDSMTSKLNALFRKNMTDKRMKMAQYVIGALAMVGSDKALRNVEIIYRKFASKKPHISLSAKEALDAAADELDISMDELSDRIIPNFNFDGLYKSFTVDGEEYRAFVNADFKLNYLNEENKTRKSPPKNTDKELVKEFKEIEKEIREVTKAQSDRLEKYMLEERRWTTHDWKHFFFENPIMFVYALKLPWGVYDQGNHLIQSFYCSEDASYYDLDDEEAVLDSDHFIGILHPIHLTSGELKSWQDKFFDLGITTVFPVLDRSLYPKDESEIAQGYTRTFFKKEVPKGADFVNTFLVKRNWIKSTGDGGRSEFIKSFKDGALKAYANIDGPAAFYQGGETPARVYEISFFKKNWNDKITIGELPDIFYSEVLYDIELLLND